MNTVLSLRNDTRPPTASVPLWIQRARRRPDRVGWLIVALCLLPLLPLLLQSGFPGGSQLEHYAFQVENSAQALREGRLYPRWSANAVSGFGSPLPSFTPPLPALLPALLQVTLTDSPELAIKLIILISQFAGAACLYRYATMLWGFRAAAVSTLMWSYAPAISVNALYVSGDLPLVLAACLIPVWLLCVDSALRPDRSRRSVLFVMLATAALIFTQPISLVAATGLWLLRALAIRGPAPDRGRSIEILAAIALGAGAAACYWLPSILEVTSVDWWGGPAQRAWAPQLSDLLQPFPVISPWVANPPLTETFGLGGWLVLAGAISVTVRRARHLRPVVVFALAGLLCGISAWTTQDVDAWGPASALTLALCAGALIHNSRVNYHGLAVALALIALAGAPALIAARWPGLPRDYSERREIEVQRRGLGEAILPSRHALPSNIAPDYGAVPSLLDSYSSGSILKVALGETAGIDVGLIAHESHGDRFQIFNRSDQPLRILTSYFPGWAATLDGQPVEVSADEDGFLSVQLQGASGELYVYLGPTSARTLAWIITWGAIALTTVLVVFVIRPGLPLSAVPDTEAAALSARNFAALVPAAALALLSLFAGPSLWAGLLPSPAITTDYLPSAPLRTENGIELVSIEQMPLLPGTGTQVVLYWRIARFVETSYGLRLSSVDPDTGAPVPISPISLIGGLPSQQWPTGRLIRDAYIVAAGLSGDLFIEIIACESARCTNGTSVTLYDRGGNNYPSGIRVPG